MTHLISYVATTPTRKIPKEELQRLLERCEDPKPTVSRLDVAEVLAKLTREGDP